VLTYAQQSKELANIEQDKLAKRIQEYRTQTELDNTEPLLGADGTHPAGLHSYKSFEAGVQSATKGEASNLHFLVDM
jgi:Arf-GAP/coiled-coil/ANK repeat/PH domain-containing protein